MSLKEFRKLIRKFIQEVPKNILIVIDEAYYQYMKPEDRLVSSNEIRENSNLIILKTFSKAYGLAGLRIGYGIGNKTIIDFLFLKFLLINSKIRMPAFCIKKYESFFKNCPFSNNLISCELQISLISLD